MKTHKNLSEFLAEALRLSGVEVEEGRKPLPLGTVRDWKGGKYEKTAKGWRLLPKGRSKATSAAPKSAQSAKSKSPKKTKASAPKATGADLRASLDKRRKEEAAAKAEQVKGLAIETIEDALSGDWEISYSKVNPDGSVDIVASTPERIKFDNDGDLEPGKKAEAAIEELFANPEDVLGDPEDIRKNPLIKLVQDFNVETSLDVEDNPDDPTAKKEWERDWGSDVSWEDSGATFGKEVLTVRLTPVA